MGKSIGIVVVVVAFAVAGAPAQLVGGPYMPMNLDVGRIPLQTSVGIHHLRVYICLHGRFQVDNHPQWPGPYTLLGDRIALRTYRGAGGRIPLCPSDMILWMDQLAPVLAVLHDAPEGGCRARIRILVEVARLRRYLRSAVREEYQIEVFGFGFGDIVLVVAPFLGGSDAEVDAADDGDGVDEKVELVVDA